MKRAVKIATYLLNWRTALGTITLGLLVIFAIGLTRDPSRIPSAFIGREVPKFSLPVLEKTALMSVDDYAGKPLVINFWASWCTSCRQEHDELVELGETAKRSGEFAVIGVNSRDQNSNALKYLNTHGQFPYSSAVDSRGRTGIDFGVYGMPETFFVDKQGVVQWRHTGPLTKKHLAHILPKIGVTQ